MSSISSHSSSRGISRMKLWTLPHARCASSAIKSHISSKRPSAWSFMNRISNVAGASDAGGGGRIGSTGGGSAANAPARPAPTGALTKRPKSSAGQVVNCPATRSRMLSRMGQRRSGRNNLLTIASRCSVISPDCIQNVDNSQAPSCLQASPAAAAVAAAALPREGEGTARRMIRIGAAAWRMAPRPQRMVIRRKTIATPRPDDASPPPRLAKPKDASTTLR